MPAKKRPSAKAQPAAPTSEQFWAASADIEGQRNRINEQIARLQQRQVELVNQTARELEELKQQLENSQNIEVQVAQARQPLLHEVASLRNALSNLQREKEQVELELERMQTEYRSHYAQMQGALTALKGVEGMLSSVDTPVGAAPLPKPVHVAPAPTPLPDINEFLAAPYESPKPKKSRSFKKVKRLAVRGVVLALILGAGWGGMKVFQNRGGEGEVAGASTTPQSTPSGVVVENPADKYRESYATVAYDQTEWETYTDQDMSFSVRYPTNATNRVKTSSNVWFLRFDGYLMKISLEETGDTIDDWWTKNGGFYEDGNTATKSTFKGRPAWIINPVGQSKTNGTTYIFGVPKGVMQVWVKTEDPESDDGQRLAKMLDSFSLLTQQ